MNALLIFVKAPIPGEVKTRLRAPLSAAQAATIYEAFARDALRGARESGEADISIAYDPRPLYPDLSWLGDAPPWFAQAAGDLGSRLSAAFDRAFGAGADKVVVIGSDCPDLEPSILRQAFKALDDTQAVLGPAEDGGYYLIGLREPRPRLFSKMEWSGAGVLKGTLERLRQGGVSCRRLPTRADVDTFGDLAALARRLAKQPGAAPHSRRALRDPMLAGLLPLPGVSSPLR